MKIISSLNELSDTSVAVTIGNFDGLHIGHQQLLNNLKAQACSNGCKTLVITFVPHPKQILSPKDHFLICDYPQRRTLLSAFGIDYLFEIDFNRDFSTLGPDQFLKQYVDVLKNLKIFLVGHDFAFGANKSGSDEIIEKYCLSIGAKFSKQIARQVDGITISSSVIRDSLLKGDMDNVKMLLGRNYSIDGVVIKGKGRGKQIGFSTANISYPSYLIIPENGVYQSQTLLRNRRYNSITNIGRNPTFEPAMPVSVETHILDFDQDIYGEMISVTIENKIRNELKFSSVNDLVLQIKEDISKIVKQ